MTMLIRACVLFLAWCVCDRALSQEVPDFARRFAEYELKVEEHQAGVSVLVHEIYISPSVNKEIEPSVTESIYRHVAEKRSHGRRFDQEVLGGGFAAATVYNSVLKAENDVYLSTGLKPGENVQKFEKSPLREARADIDLFFLPLMDVTGLSGGGKDRLASLSRCRVMSEKLLRGDRYRVLLMPPTGMALIEYVFAPTPTWAPILMTSRLNPGKAVDVAEVTVADCEKWKEFCRTETSWTRTGKDDLFLPDRISMWSEGINVELEFADWRFGRDVDVTLLDPFMFTEEGVSKTVDFRRWQHVFEAKADQRRSRK